MYEINKKISIFIIIIFFNCIFTKTHFVSKKLTYHHKRTHFPKYYSTAGMLADSIPNWRNPCRRSTQHPSPTGTLAWLVASASSPPRNPPLLGAQTIYTQKSPQRAFLPHERIGFLSTSLFFLLCFLNGLQFESSKFKLVVVYDC